MSYFSQDLLDHWKGEYEYQKECRPDLVGHTHTFIRKFKALDRAMNRRIYPLIREGMDDAEFFIYGAHVRGFIKTDHMKNIPDAPEDE